MTDGLKGVRDFSGVSALELNVRNGTVVCLEDDLPDGQVLVSWKYGGRDVDQASMEDIELRFKEDCGCLTLDDWAKKDRAVFNNLKIKLDLTVKHGPGVSVVNLNHGNGTYKYDGSAGGDINVGNGTITLHGEPGGRVIINLGNGELTSDWLLSDSGCSINLGNGNADIHLRPGSGVTLDGTVGIGSISAPAGVRVRKSHQLGATVEGSIGDGAATMNISIGNGSVDIHQD